MKEYSFVRDEWDGNPTTVWTRKKQYRLTEIILQKYPRPIDLKNKLIKINDENANVLGHYMDPDWSREQYVKFIQNHVIKYSTTGKRILSHLIGAGVGTLIFYLTKRQMDDGIEDPTNDEKEMYVKFAGDESLEADMRSKIHDIGNRIQAYNNQRFSPTARKLIPLSASFLGKSATSYGAYKLSNALDKEKKIK